MDKILQVVECSTALDGQRFEKIIRTAIEENTITLFKAFETTTTAKAHKKRIEREQKQAVEYEGLSKEKKEKKEKETESLSLMDLIQQRSKERHVKMNRIIDSIESAAKDEGKGKKRKQKEMESMPSEEEFLKLQESMFKKKKPRGS